MIEHELITRKFALPKQSTVDSLTEMFRAAVSQKGSVQKVVFSSDPLELSVDVFVPIAEPGKSDPPTGDPEDVWQTLSLVEMEEVEAKDSQLNISAVSMLTALMVKAAERRLSGVAWAVGDIPSFLRWIGLPETGDLPASFWNVPLIEVKELQDGALVLMCAKSSRLGTLHSEVGFLIHMEKENA